MSLKRNKKQSLAIRLSAMRSQKIGTAEKTSQQPELVAVPVLSPRTHGYHKHAVVHQDTTSSATRTKSAQQSDPLTAPVLSPQAARRDTHGRFSGKAVKIQDNDSVKRGEK
jgi:hypothetical protein